MKDNLYETLGINRKANKKEIKKAYRGKAKIHHPDHKGNPDDFSKINMAYSILIDDKKRKCYDETGKTNPDTKDEAKSVAYDRLGQLFLEIVVKKKDSIHKLDVIGLLKDVILNQVEKCKGIINEEKQIRMYFKKIRKRIKHKGRGINIFDAIIEDKIRNCNFMISQNEFELKIFDEMKKVLKDFDFDYDKVEKVYGMNRYTTKASFFDWG